MEKEITEKKKLWNKDFLLLWQGQLVSYLGDVIYSFALSFWILEMTGSTALMGLVTAASMVPRLILGPIAGVWVDKWDRKKIIVITDFLRGVVFSYIGFAALTGTLQIWALFAAGMIGSVCSAFFNPAVSSVKPDLVDKDYIIKANSITGLSQAGSSALGNAISGILYAALGASMMFLFDGISYLFSAFTEVFIAVPKNEQKSEKTDFKADFKEGLSFVWNFKAFKIMFILCCAINFFANAAFVLMPAYFNEMAFLGKERYGVLMSVASIGMMAGSLILGVINLKPKQRYPLMAAGFVIESIIFVLLPFMTSFWPMLIFAPIAMGFNMIGNTIFQSVGMLVIPADMRGKVFAIVETFLMGLTPVGIAMGGVLGQLISVKLAMVILLLATLIISIGFVAIRPIKTAFEYDPDVDEIGEFIERSNSAFDRKANKKDLSNIMEN